MPFVTQQRREEMSLGKPPESVGDLCYLAYQQMIAKWRAERRWTTAHKIKLDLNNGSVMSALASLDHSKCFSTRDFAAAAQLAWEVFFHREVMPYEEEKAFENGEI